jgi:hypothetical protein
MMATALARARICLKSARRLGAFQAVAARSDVDLIGDLEYKRIVSLTLSL